MWNTVLFRFGLIGMLCDKFKWLVASFAISSCLSVAEMTSRGSELGSGGNKAGVSSGGGMQSLSIINTIGARCALRGARCPHCDALRSCVRSPFPLVARAPIFHSMSCTLRRMLSDNGGSSKCRPVRHNKMDRQPGRFGRQVGAAQPSSPHTPPTMCNCRIFSFTSWSISDGFVMAALVAA